MAQMHIQNPTTQSQPSAEELVGTKRTGKKVFKPPNWAGKAQKSASLIENDGMKESSSEGGKGGEEVVNIRVASPKRAEGKRSKNTKPRRPKKTKERRPKNTKMRGSKTGKSNRKAPHKRRKAGTSKSSSKIGKSVINVYAE